MKKQYTSRCSFMLALSLAAGAAGCGEGGMSENVNAEASALTVVGEVAFVQSDITTGTGPVNANASFSFNSSGATNQLNRTGVGLYRVDVPNLGSNVGGTVQVTAVGNGDKRCKVGSWGPSGGVLQIYVACYDNFGNLADSLFMANYLGRTDTPGPDTAYLFAFDPYSRSYDAGTTWSWNSTGGANTITHTPGTNLYAVSLAGQDLSQGTVEVTASGSSNNYCKVVSWGGSTVTVACFTGDSTTQPIETPFNLIFSTRSPNGTPSSSYLWANNATATSYHPFPTYALGLLSLDCCAPPRVVTTAPTITHTPGSGVYGVRLPAMASLASTPLNAKVTAYGSGNASCMIASHSTSGADGLVTVKCFDPLGPGVDTRFTLTYSSFAYTIH